MTEIEAKTKWCPMARVVWAKHNTEGKWITKGAVAFNRARIEFTAHEEEVGLCLASACMMWRTAKDGGYCGLAGIPVIDPPAEEPTLGDIRHPEKP